MIRTIKRKSMSLLLAVAVFISAFAGMEIIGVRASAEGMFTVAQINSVIDWAVNQLGHESWVNQWGNTIESIDSEGGNCASFVHTAFGINGFEYAGPNASGWYQNHFAVHYGEEPPRGSIALYNGGYWGHVALSLGNGRIIQAGLYDWVDITSYNSFSNLTYVGWCTPNDIGLPTYDPLVTPTPHLNKSTYNVGETINFTWDASSANSPLHHYWINLSSSDGGEGFDLNAQRTPSYSFTVNKVGTYTFQVWADDLRESNAPSGSITFSVVAEHVHDWTDWEYYPATEAAEAYRARTCKTCGEVQTEAIVCDGKNHVLEKREAVEASCTGTGRIEFWLCTLCNLKFSDASGTTEIGDITAPAKGHSWDSGEITTPATTTSEGIKTYICTVCGETKTESIPKLTEPETPDVPDIHTHTYSTDWSHDGTHHWHAATCEHTSEISEKAAHSWNAGEITKPATTTAEGVKTYTCTVCGATRTESVPKLEVHTHTYSADWSRDDTHHWHAATCEHTSEISEKAAHSWDGGKVTTAATTSSEGVKTYTCTVCGRTRTESIPKLSGGGSRPSGGSGGGGSTGSRRPTSTVTETVTVNGKSQSWSEAVTTIEGTAPNGTAVISGSTDIPADIVAAAAKKNVRLEVKADDTFTWVIDAAKVGEGSKYLSVSYAAIYSSSKLIKSSEACKDFRVTESRLGTSVSLRYNAGTAQNGKFANLFLDNGSELKLVGAVKVDAAGGALLPVVSAGVYRIVVSDETKLIGDLDNSMKLSALDAALLLKKLSDGSISEENTAKCDFNGDGNVNALDAAAVLKFLVQTV